MANCRAHPSDIRRFARRIAADGVTEVTRWALREWSLTKAGGNHGAAACFRSAENSA